ncbi:hypothetical protein SAMN05421505_1783 [Sinosporangium album]|uniref:CU044_5270 family protein n=1 Tax=Sinosporangium album TaxID=504805 RepID=A0A1G8LU82_9ACTN|nr:CU044_5270 family protein [Sinosporangium album]SDI58740.1 hypothetical protein SAMN05421505_1783 [Sinosporangium album]
MDELNLLRDLRSETPEPDDDRLRTLLLRSLPNRRRPRLLPYLLVLGTGAVAVVTAGGLMASPGVEAPPPKNPSTFEYRGTLVDAETTLRQMAASVEKNEPDAIPRPEQWMYRKVIVKQADHTTGEAQEYWRRYDGGQQAVRIGQGPLDLHTHAPEPDDDDLTPQEYAAKLADLPTDPDKLLAHVKSDRHWRIKPTGDPGDQEHSDARAFRVLSLYLEQQVPTPSTLDAAIFRALAKIPGVRVHTGIRDALDRPGIGIEYDAGAPGVGTSRNRAGDVISRSYVILAPDTYRFLGRRVDYLRDETLGGEVLSPRGSGYATAEVASGIVDKPGQVP